MGVTRGLIFTLLSTLIAAAILIYPDTASADFSFTASQTTIIFDQEIELNTNLTLQGQENEIYYLEGAFKKEGGSNYFGLTWNGTEWIPYTASANFTNLKQITTDNNGHWSGYLKVKLDSSSNYFTGSGNYILRIKRFTQTGSSSWTDNDLLITVSTPDNSPTRPILPTNTEPEPTLSSTPATPAPTNSDISPSPLPTPTPTKIPTLFTISSTPATIRSSESFAVNINITELEANVKYYLKGAFIKNGSSNYFGKTKINNLWVANNQSYSSQFPITTDNSGSWNGNLEVMADEDDSGFDGNGEYIFKVGRYRETGSGPSWSNSVNIQIEKELTPTPLPNNIPSLIPSPTKNEIQNTIKSLSIKPKLPLSLIASSSSIAGIASTAAEIDSPTLVKEVKQTNYTLATGLLFILFGIGLLAYFWKKR